MAEATKVGEAEIIRNEVVNVGEAELIPINVGDDLLRDAVIRTSTDSDARFGLIDNTKLTLGPGSTLKIDRAVYSDDSHYKQITIRLTEGAFRFITGNSGKKSYRIETPTASIGVRGTILDIRISEKQTLVALQDGKASVCAASKCTQLLERGHTANVTREGCVIQIKRDLVPSWTFASVCSGQLRLMFAAACADEESKPHAAGAGQGRKERRDHPLLSGRPADDGQQLRIKSQCPQGYFPSDAQRHLARSAAAERPRAGCLAADVAIDGFAAGANQPAVGQSAIIGAVAAAIARTAYLVRAIVVPSNRRRPDSPVAACSARSWPRMPHRRCGFPAPSRRHRSPR